MTEVTARPATAVGPWSFPPRAPAPLDDVLSGRLTVDPCRSMDIAGDHLLVRLESGAETQVRFTVPAPGVLRIRAGTADASRHSAQLVDFDEAPTALALTEGAVTVSGPGVVARWLGVDAQAEYGAFRSPELALLGVPTPRLSGCLTDRGKVAGWLLSTGMGPTEEVYGGGGSVQGPRLRGRRRRCVNRETHGAAGLDVAYLNTPFFWSDGGWGAYLHTAYPVDADLGHTHTDIAMFATDDPELDLFLFNGDPGSILRDYLTVTGASRRLPDWALGVWMSRCSYVSAEHVHAVLDELLAAGCPVDVVHVDGWVAGDVITDLACNWQPDRTRFPSGWIRGIRDRGPRVSLWVNPYVSQTSECAAELAEQGLLARGPGGRPAETPDVPGRLILDFTRSELNAWWGVQVQNLVAEGASVIKTDFGEEIPDDAIFSDGRTGAAVRNEYPLLYQEATAHALRSAAGEDFCLFARSGTAGAHRNPVHWVGDTPATWQGLASALRGCLSMSLSGFTYVAHDVGGFWGDAGSDVVAEVFAALTDFDHHTDPMSPDVDPELYVRWTQWGTFSPVMRFHGTGRREPTAYPEPARSAAIAACRTRRELNGYLSQAADDCAASGLPMMRPMVLAFADRPDGRSADLQYLLGRDILVAPILQPGGRRTFWVPPGTWEPLMGLPPLTGPGWHTVRCGLGAFPAYRRAVTSYDSGGGL